ncbi:MAG: roadblock/LC7 domain-containing protein [Chloroflexi bacterium]|nr:roadblock/LC7 domain-containing protein [Chloroflexota bacterium]
MTAELTRLLRKLQAADGTDLIAVVTMDGLLIDAAAGNPDIDASVAAVAACNGLLMARAIGGELGRGTPHLVSIEFDDGLLLMQPLDDDLGLVIVAPRDANLGRLRLVMRRYAQELVRVTTT